MAITNTTPRQIRHAVKGLIEGITPTLYAATAWRYVASPAMVGGQLRVFSIEHSPADAAGTANSEGPEGAFGDGLWGGDGLEWAYEMRIVASYQGLRDDEDDEIVTSDAADLWRVLAPTVGSSAAGIPGLVRIKRGQPEARQGAEAGEEDPDQGAWIIDHVFTVNYKQAD